MSVSRGSGNADKFDELEQYSRSSDYIVRAAALDGTKQQTFNPPNPPSIEPAGGLHRGEVAELVCVIIEDAAIDVVEEGSAGTTPGKLQFENELKTKAPMDSTSIDQDGSNDVDIRGNDYDDDNLVARWFMHQHAAFNDTTNGSGGGSAGAPGPWKVYNFRRMFGQGPVLREDDVLYERAAFRINDMANQDVRAENYFRTFWDIGDRGDFDVYS